MFPYSILKSKRLAAVGYGNILKCCKSLLLYHEVLQPVCEAHFSDGSFAYRPERGVSAALHRYCWLGNRNSCAAKLDMTACFNNLDHGVLLNAVADFFSDSALTELISLFLKMPLLEDGELSTPEKGVLQGAPISPTLSNLYLHAFDRCMEENGIPFLRYADDIVLFAGNTEALQKSMTLAIDFLETQLKLSCNLKKCQINSPARLHYLGYPFESDHRGLIAPENSTTPQITYRNWQESTRFDNKRRVEVLSDGILRQKDFSLLFESDTEKTELPILSTDVINCYSSVVFDSGFLEKALSVGILVNLFDAKGDLLGRFLPNTALRSPITTHEQLACYYDETYRLELAVQFVLASLHNSRLNIRYYQRQEENPVYDEALKTLNRLQAKIKQVKNYESLLLLEAQVREAYFGCYDSFLRQEGFAYEKRSRRPPQNAFNSMLSFGNTMLYNLIATEINRTSLDIRVGFLHATNRRKESLNLDIAEIFKPLVVDRTALALVNRRAIREEHFRREENGGVYLNEEGKRIFMRAFYEKLDTSVKVDGQGRTYNQIITEEARKLVRHFRSLEQYKPFKQTK